MDEIISKLLQLRLLRLLKKNTAPRWVVFAVDLLIVIVSTALVITSDFFRVGGSFAFSPVVRGIFVVLGYVFVSLVTRSFACVIRLSVVEDVYKVIQLVFFSTVLLCLVNLIYNVNHPNAIMFSYWSLFFIATIVLSLTIAERSFIKYVFRSSTAKDSRKRVIVLGSTINSFLLASSLKNEVSGKFYPVALLGLTSGKKGYDVNGIPVEQYDVDMLKDTFEKYDTDTLIFLSSQLDMLRNGFADEFLKNDITLLQVNQVEEFDVSKDDESHADISKSVRSIRIEDLLGRDPIINDKTMVKQNIHDECVLITGAAGSIGSEIVRQVASYGAKDVVLVDQAETPMHDLALEMKKSFPNINIHLFIGDVQNSHRMEEAFRKYRPKFIFHAAAYKHVPMMEINPTEAVMTNVMGTKNIADLALKYGVFKFVMISTDKAVNPTNIMGVTKRIAEIYVQSLFFHEQRTFGQTQFITTRFGNVLGSNGSVIPLFRKQIENGGPVTVTHKDIIRYFMTIPEACSLVLQAGCMGKGGEIYIFDMGKPVKIYDLATKMIFLAGLRPNIDVKIVETGLRPGEKLYEELLNDKEKTTATMNEKIMIAKVRTYDYGDVCKNIDQIILFAKDGAAHDMVRNMKLFVPEYKSNNSDFEAIDAEIEKDGAEKPVEKPQPKVATT
jgi:FlaA1/EpsC-like NDP-sugar epimerase